MGVFLSGSGQTIFYIPAQVIGMSTLMTTHKFRLCYKPAPSHAPVASSEPTVDFESLEMVFGQYVDLLTRFGWLNLTNCFMQ